MKNLVFKIKILICVLSMCTACSREKSEFLSCEYDAADCFSYHRGFIETYRLQIEHDDVFFVKGVIVSTSNKGRKIKILEDLKGNYKGKSSFTLCNHWEFGASYLYEVNDILLILMSKCTTTSGKFYTIGCSYSTLLYSKGNVTGILVSKSDVITMSWKELQPLLVCGCESNMDFEENYHANIHKDDVFFIKATAVNEFNFHGLKISPIKDLKGNLKGNLPSNSSFIVWGKGDIAHGIDPVHMYAVDPNYGYYTLYMLVKPIVSEVDPIFKRKMGDYTTIDCAYSVVPIDIVSQKMKNENIVRVGNEWISSEEFENRFSLN